MTLCYLGLGSNLGDPVRQLEEAVARLAQLPDSKLIAVSSLYASAPIGPQDQPDFINAVAALETELAPLALLDALQELERMAGRKRLRHWGERTLDVDILLYGDACIDLPRLTVPHPEMTRRAFVLQPLAELAPGLLLPDGSAIADYLSAPDVSRQQLRRLTR